MTPIVHVKSPVTISRFKFFGLFLLVCVTKVGAQTLPYPAAADWGPNTIALGGAGSASVYNLDAFLGNPAGLVYYADKNAFGGSWADHSEGLNSWSVGLVDGKRKIISGFHFAWVNVNGSRRQSYTLAATYKTPYGAVGGSVHVYNFDNLVGPGNGWYISQSAGIIAPVAYGLSVGIHMKHLPDFNDNNKIPPALHMGLMYTKSDSLRLSMETDRRWGQAVMDWNYSFGADILVSKYISIKGGYRVASEENSYWSSGLTFSAPRAELSSYYMKNTEGPNSDGFGIDATARF